MPKWIHDRAMSLKKDMKETYGPEKAEQVAFAVATQQSHRLGKSPKKYGTSEGKTVARAKFDRPRKEYKKTAGEIDMSAYNQLKMASFADELAEIVKESKVQAITVGGRTKRPFADKVKNFIASGRKKGFIFLKPEHRATRGPKEVFG